MKRIVNWFLIVAIVQPKAWAADGPVLIRAPQTYTVEYQAWLATNPRLQPYSEWWVRTRVPKSQEMELERKLEVAQIEFLQGGMVRAKELFQILLQMEHAQDWRADERKAFAYAHLRLAQLANDGEERENQVKAAAAWGTVGLSEGHFPPPIWKSYVSALKNVFHEQLDLDLWFPNIRFLLVDGRPFEGLLSTKLPVDSHKHRFTLVFDHAKSVTIVLSWNEFKNWRPAVSPLITGSCEKFSAFGGASLPAGAQIFFSNECVVGANSPAPTLPLAVAKSEAPVELQPLGGDWHKPAFKESKSSSKTWLWAGLGVIALGSLAFLNQKDKEKSSPTTTVGF